MISSLLHRRIVFAPEWSNRCGILEFCRNVELQLGLNGTQIMKNDAAATVAAVPFNNTRLVIKQYNFKNVYKFLSRSIRPSSAKKTWDNAYSLSKIGIGSVKPVALVEDRLSFFRVRSFFVGTYIPGQDARAFFNDNDKTGHERRTAAHRIVDSLCEFHSKGLFLGDTKDTNIIVGLDSVAWVDLEELSSPHWELVKQKKSIRDWRVFFYNWRNNSVARHLFHEAAKEKLSRQNYWEIVRSAAFYRKKKFSITEFQTPLPGVCKEPNNLLNQAIKIAHGLEVPGWEKVDSSARAIVARKRYAGNWWYCKVFLARNRLEGLKTVFRLGRGARAVRNEQMMQVAGFLAPETLCWGKHKEKEYTVSKGVNGITLHAWILQHQYTSAYKRKVLAELGEEVAALHRVGFAHGDLRLGNIMLENTADHFRFIFIDNERTTLYRKISRRSIIQNLRQINTDAISLLSKTDRLRIFRAYITIYGGFDRDEQKKLIAEIERLTRKRLAVGNKAS